MNRNINNHTDRIKFMKWLEEMDDSHPLYKRIEFVTMQVCEKNSSEMNYKNICRKFISFDLRDDDLMLEVGKMVKPFGFLQHYQEKFVNSRFSFFRIWCEKGFADRGREFLRRLYKDNPEKFSDLEFSHEKNSMFLVRCKYSLSQMTSQKQIFLKDESEQKMLGDMANFRKKAEDSERMMNTERAFVNEFSGENREGKNLLSDKSE